MSTTLTVQAMDDQSVYYGPALGTLGPDDVPTALFLPRSEYIAMGEPPWVTVTVEPATDPGPAGEPEPPAEP